jgi:hypothetical protein
LSGADASDYSLVEPTGLSGSITPASLTVSGTSVGPKVYDGTFTALLVGGTLLGVVIGDTFTLIPAGSFSSKNVGTGIAVTATDSLSGADASDYSLVEPTGLSGSITPASGSSVVSGNSGASNAQVLAAVNARTQIVENFIYPQFGANPQIVNASSSIDVINSTADSSDTSDKDSHRATAVNVSMKIGANGTLKIENGGLRLPSNLVVGNE